VIHENSVVAAITNAPSGSSRYSSDNLFLLLSVFLVFALIIEEYQADPFQACLTAILPAATLFGFVNVRKDFIPTISVRPLTIHRLDISR
jgi:hypothetical protein